MGRAKIQMKKLENRVSRQVTYSKRKAGIKKKVSELSILCDTTLGCIMFSPGGRLATFSSHERIEDAFIRFLRDESHKINDLEIKDKEHLMAGLTHLKYEAQIVDLFADKEALEEEFNMLREQRILVRDTMRSNNPYLYPVTSIRQAEARERAIIDALQRVKQLKEELSSNHISNEEAEGIEIPAVGEIAGADWMTGGFLESNPILPRDQPREDLLQETTSSLMDPHLSINSIGGISNWNLPGFSLPFKIPMEETANVDWMSGMILESNPFLPGDQQREDLLQETTSSLMDPHLSISSMGKKSNFNLPGSSLPFKIPMRETANVDWMTGNILESNPILLGDQPMEDLFQEITSSLMDPHLGINFMEERGNWNLPGSSLPFKIPVGETPNANRMTGEFFEFNPILPGDQPREDLLQETTSSLMDPRLTINFLGETINWNLPGYSLPFKIPLGETTNVNQMTGEFLESNPILPWDQSREDLLRQTTSSLMDPHLSINFRRETTNWNLPGSSLPFKIPVGETANANWMTGEFLESNPFVPGDQPREDFLQETISSLMDPHLNINFIGGTCNQHPPGSSLPFMEIVSHELLNASPDEQQNMASGSSEEQQNIQELLADF